ncbi:hypothetical protein J1614_010927 [Plenodomus biglobosus]|nr:hypothetical protein J1614_010927 [Plenodomus biglobosus]
MGANISQTSHQSPPARHTSDPLPPHRAELPWIRNQDFAPSRPCRRCANCAGLALRSYVTVGVWVKRWEGSAGKEEGGEAHAYADPHAQGFKVSSVEFVFDRFEWDESECLGKRAARFEIETLGLWNGGELGFEGVDKFADKYHDKVYDHLPAVPIGKRRHQQQSHARESRQDYNKDGQQAKPGFRDQRDLPAFSSEYQQYSTYPDKGYSHNGSGLRGGENGYRDDRTMSSYGPNSRSEGDYQPRSTERYYEDERNYKHSPDPVPRGRDTADSMGSQQMTSGYEQSDRGRPNNQRRGSSWSPPRRHKDERKNRSQSRTRARSPAAKDKQHRLAATLGGALIGGIAGSHAGKGKKYDTAATFIGAVVGGLGAREATEFYDKKKHQKDDRDFGGEERKGGGRREERYDRGERQDRDERYDERYDDGYDRDDRYENEHRNKRGY